MTGVLSKPWKTKATKATEFGIVSWDTKELMIWADKIDSGTGKLVYEIDSSGKGK